MVLLFRNMFTQYLHKGKEGTPTAHDQSKDSIEMPTEVLGLSIEEALTMFGLRNISAVNAGCILVLVLRLRQCCGHLSLMCEVCNCVTVYLKIYAKIFIVSVNFT